MLISDAAAAAAGLDTSPLERRELTLMGIGHPILAWAEVEPVAVAAGSA